MLQLPLVVPIPQFHQHVVTAGNNEWLSGMDDDGSNVIRMSFELVNSLKSVVVENPDLHVIGTRHDPALPRDELGCTDRKITDLKRFDKKLALVVPNVDVSVVEGNEHPWFRRMEICRLDSIGMGQ